MQLAWGTRRYLKLPTIHQTQPGTSMMFTYDDGGTSRMFTYEVHATCWHRSTFISLHMPMNTAMHAACTSGMYVRACEMRVLSVCTMPSAWHRRETDSAELMVTCNGVVKHDSIACIGVEVVKDKEFCSSTTKDASSLLAPQRSLMM